MSHVVFYCAHEFFPIPSPSFTADREKTHPRLHSSPRSASTLGNATAAASPSRCPPAPLPLPAPHHLIHVCQPDHPRQLCISRTPRALPSAVRPSPTSPRGCDAAATIGQPLRSCWLKTLFPYTKMRPSVSHVVFYCTCDFFPMGPRIFGRRPPLPSEKKPPSPPQLAPLCSRSTQRRRCRWPLSPPQPSSCSTSTSRSPLPHSRIRRSCKAGETFSPLR